MRVLVACEESQVVCAAFRAMGHEAYSCDIQECSGGHPEWHLKQDAITTLYGSRWDLVIAHPPCNKISNAGAVHLYKGGNLNQERFKEGQEGAEFFMKFYRYGLEGNRIAIENPVHSKIFKLPKHNQEIQPFHFGHPLQKKTRLWLFGLPPLIHTNIVKPIGLLVSRRGTRAADGAKSSAKERSKTFHGIAWAMAEQWS